jgi:hypothetical protein
LANTDHTFRYVYRVPKRNGVDQAWFEINLEFMNLETSEIEI